MILEHADIRIDPAQASAFEEAITRGVTTVIAQAKGQWAEYFAKRLEAEKQA